MRAADAHRWASRIGFGNSGLVIALLLGIIRGVRKSSLARSSKKSAPYSEDIHALEIGNLLNSDHIDVSRHDGSIGARINLRAMSLIITIFG